MKSSFLEERGRWEIWRKKVEDRRATAETDQTKTPSILVLLETPDLVKKQKSETVRDLRQT